MRSAHPLTRVGGRIALLIFGCALGLGAAEFTFRLLPLAPSPHDLRALHEVRLDRPWLFGMRPGAESHRQGGVHYTVNADGFRDRSYARPKPPGTFRVVVLGCSITFGYGVEAEDTFPKVMEERLNALAPTPRTEVLNLGVSGYNPYTEAALFSDVGVSYQPDLVLVQFCINDLNDPTMHFDEATTYRLRAIPDAAFPNPELRRPLPPPPSLATRLCHRSQLCTFVADRFTPLPEAAVLVASLRPRDVATDAEIAWLRALYSRIATAAAGVGARFAVIVFPYATQVDGRGPIEVQAQLAAMGRDAGWPVVDLLPTFEEHARSGAPLYLDLWHPTVAGHRMAAEALITELRCRGLLPLRPGPDCPAAARPGTVPAPPSPG
jgi:lysophospholipase L1-like esterase